MAPSTPFMILLTRFLDRVLDDYGVYLLVMLLWGLLGLLSWAVARRNRPGERPVRGRAHVAGLIVPD